MLCTAGEITDLLSFYTLPSSVLGNDKYNTLKAAFMYYTVPGATPLPQLMTDALILAHARCGCWLLAAALVTWW